MIEIAVLVDDNTAFQHPSTEEMLSWDKTRREDFEKQISAWHAREKARQSLNSSNATIKGGGPMSDLALQKRKKREDRRKLALDSPLGNVYSLSKDIDNATPVPSDLPNTKIANYNVHIPGTLIYLPWYQPSKYENLAAAKEAAVWRYPSTLGEQASCRVFRDLWERGYFLGSGLKFGGEFLVYPGMLSKDIQLAWTNCLLTDQVIRFGITHILSLLWWNPHLLAFVPWKLWLMVD
ncbi:MAG TPA: hypothetical protein VGO47_02685 [Chlamydiales bacterium]|jgi:tRNA-splicing endonuclease subunit Sen34|nr:hypothetical protein [Chlamydiales bacterium]